MYLIRSWIKLDFLQTRLLRTTMRFLDYHSFKNLLDYHSSKTPYKLKLISKSNFTAAVLGSMSHSSGSSYFSRRTSSSIRFSDLAVHHHSRSVLWSRDRYLLSPRDMRGTMPETMFQQQLQPFFFPDSQLVDASGDFLYLVFHKYLITKPVQFTEVFVLHKVSIKETEGWILLRHIFTEVPHKCGL